MQIILIIRKIIFHTNKIINTYNIIIDIIKMLINYIGNNKTIIDILQTYRRIMILCKS